MKKRNPNAVPRTFDEIQAVVTPDTRLSRRKRQPNIVVWIMDDVGYGHLSPYGGLVDMPSYAVAPGQEIRVREKSREMGLVREALDQSARGQSPAWLAVDRDSFSGRMLERPQRPSIPIAAQEQLVVELYSK